ncbi:MAG: hypothetical protein AAF605_08845 [Myxococcota bacterium]
MKEEEPAIGAANKSEDPDENEPEDRGEEVQIMEPLLIRDGAPNRGVLVELAFELAKKSAALRASLPPALARSVADLVRAMNCYYSNLIEGHDTHPVPGQSRRGTSIPQSV